MRWLERERKKMAQVWMTAMYYQLYWSGWEWPVGEDGGKA